MTPTMWARVAGVGVAGLVIIANFLSLPYYPVWSLMYVGMGVLLIYALVAHGGASGRKVELS